MLKISSRSDHFKNIFFIVLISNIGNFFQLLYQVFGGKFLPPTDYAALSSINYILSIICLPLTIIQIGAVSGLASYKNKKDKIVKFYSYIKSFFKQNLYFACIYIPLMILILKKYFDLPFLKDWFIICFILIDLFLVFLVTPLITLLQVSKKYIIQNILGAFQQLIRLIAYVLFFTLFYKTYISGIFGNIFGFLFIFIFLYFYYKNSIFKYNVRASFFLKKNEIIIFKNLNISALLIIYITVATNFDVIIFTKLFPGDISGYYSGVSVIAKIPMFISDIVISYLFVETTSNFVLKKKSKLLFFSVFIFSLSVFIFVLFVFYLFGENILTIIFNKNFSIYYKELLLLSIAYSILALCKIIVYILISNKMWKFFLILYLIFLIFLYFLYTYSLDMHSFILNVLYLFISNLFILLFFFFKYKIN
jgi:O-antigen/teichoic acid export membrane protein